MLLRNRDLAIATAKELVDAYHLHCSEGATGVFQYNIVECFPAIQRIHKDSRKAIEIKGIRKIHTLRYSGDGIKATKTSCHECCKLDSVVSVRGLQRQLHTLGLSSALAIICQMRSRGRMRRRRMTGECKSEDMRSWRRR